MDEDLERIGKVEMPELPKWVNTAHRLNIFISMVRYQFNKQQIQCHPFAKNHPKKQ